MTTVEDDDTRHTRTLTQADIEAIREAVFEKAPISLMDTQTILLENKKLKGEVAQLQHWYEELIDVVAKAPKGP